MRRTFEDAGVSSGPRPFGELILDIPGLSNAVLSQRLNDLEFRGVVSRTSEASPPRSGRYLLTPLGQKLLPALSAIGDVGRKHCRAAENGSSSARMPSACEGATGVFGDEAKAEPAGKST
ncbi:MAG: winged helix-turn-helix transcriptional regulator [Pseudorhizobium sp.]